MEESNTEKKDFENLGLIKPVLRAVREEGYETPSPIQAKAIPHVLSGRDVLGCAQTGTGKTAAFALPILTRLYEKGRNKKTRREVRALVLSPTRELAQQIADSFGAYGKYSGLKHTVIYGGVKQRGQARALKNGVDIVIATPGRLLDLMGQRLISLDWLDVFVLDEADRMLDMGFIPDVRKIVSALPEDRQTLFFSATLSPSIESLAFGIVRDPIRVEVAPSATPAENIRHVLYYVEKKDKRALLTHVLKDKNVTRALVFTRTKRQADYVSRHLRKNGFKVSAIHGDKTQGNRARVLDDFKKGRVPVLVATDVAARGLDVDDISHVFNYELPEEAEVYVHRTGRTARAEADGAAFSFCSLEERALLSDIEKLIGFKLDVDRDHPFVSWAPEPIPKEKWTRHKLMGVRRGRRRRR